MNLIDQVFAQQSSGSAEGQGFGQFFVAGLQAGQHQQQIDIAKQQLAMEIGQARLKQTLLQQDAAMNQAKLELFLQGREDTAKATQAFAGLAAQVSPLLEDGQIDEAQNLLMREGAANAFLLTDPRFKNLYDFTTKAQDAKLELLRARGSEYTPKLVTVTDAKTGKEYPVIQTGPHVSQVVDPAKDDLKKRDQELRLMQLQQKLPEAAKAELKSLYKEIDRKKEQLDALPEMSGMIWNRQPNPKRAALQKEIDDLRVKANQLSQVPAAGAAPSAPSAAATPSPALSNLRLGSIVIQNGKRYAYIGGDPNDPNSYAEVTK